MKEIKKESNLKENNLKEKDIKMKSALSEGLSKTGDSMFLCRMQRFNSELGGVVAHSHEWIEVMYCFDGDMVVKLDGVDYPFVAGSLAVIPSNRIHEITGNGKGLYLSAKFPARLLSTAVDADEFSGIIPFIFKEPSCSYVISREKLQHSQIVDRVNAIVREYTERDFGYRIAMRSHIYYILLQIIRHWNSERNIDMKKLNTENSGMIFDALVYIHNNYQHEISLLDLAEMSNVSYSYFSRRFAAVTGKTFAGYLCAVRLCAAEHELIFTQKSVTAISTEVGFTDPSYFTRRFTEKNKMSPLAYRRKYASRMSVMKGE